MSAAGHERVSVQRRPVVEATSGCSDVMGRSRSMTKRQGRQRCRQGSGVA